MFITPDEILRALTRKTLDPSHPRSYTALKRKFEDADLPRAMNVGPTAQLGGEVAHFHDSHSIAVLIAKESQSSVANGVLVTRLLDRDTRILANMPIDMSFDGRKFFLWNKIGRASCRERVSHVG